MSLNSWCVVSKGRTQIEERETLKSLNAAETRDSSLTYDCDVTTLFVWVHKIFIQRVNTNFTFRKLSAFIIQQYLALLSRCYEYLRVNGSLITKKPVMCNGRKIYWKVLNYDTWDHVDTFNVENFYLNFSTSIIKIRCCHSVYHWNTQKLPFQKLVVKKYAIYVLIICLRH